MKALLIAATLLLTIAFIPVVATAGPVPSCVAVDTDWPYVWTSDEGVRCYNAANWCIIWSAPDRQLYVNGPWGCL